MSDTSPTDAAKLRAHPPLAIAVTRIRPAALVLSVLLAIGYGVTGSTFFLSPGHDMMEGLGYAVGSVLLLLAAAAAVAAVLASRGRREAWALLTVPPALIFFALVAAMP
jgi:hypothetical protein